MNQKRAPKTPIVRRVSIDNNTLDLDDDAPLEAQREAQPDTHVEETQDTTTNTQNKQPNSTYADQGNTSPNDETIIEPNEKPNQKQIQMLNQLIRLICNRMKHRMQMHQNM